ncbi:MAG: hypothetical protein Q8O95_02630 [bacterium]|nr:hypothetical protein [bacterium]
MRANKLIAFILSTVYLTAFLCFSYMPVSFAMGEMEEMSSPPCHGLTQMLEQEKEQKQSDQKTCDVCQLSEEVLGTQQYQTMSFPELLILSSLAIIPSSALREELLVREYINFPYPKYDLTNPFLEHHKFIVMRN